MNKSIQFQAELVGAFTGVPVSVAIPLKITEGQAFRVRAVEFWKTDIAGVDEVDLLGLSRLSQANVKASMPILRLATDFIARAALGIETTGTSSGHINTLHFRTELWEYDYRLVMPPFFHLGTIGQLTQWVCFLTGENVPATQGQRNAIIAWQGGLWDA